MLALVCGIIALVLAVLGILGDAGGVALWVAIFVLAVAIIVGPLPAPRWADWLRHPRGRP